MAHGYLGDGYGKSGMRDPDNGRRDNERAEWRERDERSRFMFENRDEDRSDWSQDRPRGERFSEREHGHYLNWRQQQIDALDRDYEEYCRERQQQFHQDFDSWRRNREIGSGSSGRESEELELTAAQEMDAMPGGTTGTGQARGTAAGAVDTATLGTNNSENSHVGRS